MVYVGMSTQVCATVLENLLRSGTLYYSTLLLRFPELTSNSGVRRSLVAPSGCGLRAGATLRYDGGDGIPQGHTRRDHIKNHAKKAGGHVPTSTQVLDPQIPNAP